MTELMNEDEIRTEAKSLGVRNWHNKKLENLVEELREMKAVETVKPDEPEVHAQPEIEDISKPLGDRLTVPKMSVETLEEDARQKLLDELNRKRPHVEHQYRRAGTPLEEIRAKGFVPTGEKLGNEIVVGTDKESFLAWKKKYHARERKKMDAVDTEGSKILSQTAIAKKGT